MGCVDAIGSFSKTFWHVGAILASSITNVPDDTFDICRTSIRGLFLSSPAFNLTISVASMLFSKSLSTTGLTVGLNTTLKGATVEVGAGPDMSTTGWSMAVDAEASDS